MSSPRIVVDLKKIRSNTQTLVRRLNARGIRVTGVSKSFCGHPAVAQAMLDGGVVGLAEARVSNADRLRKAGMTCPITLVRTPMLSEVDQIVRTCEASYNTEIAVVEALSAAAIQQGVTHGVILMVEMGDMREGILPENLPEIAEQVVQMKGVALKGIGANFACLNGVAPSAAKMALLSSLADEIEKTCGPVIQTVSGGNSANLPWALAEHSIGRVNDLRLGEAILLGVDPITGGQIGGLFKDAFTLVAEVIETDAQPAPRHSQPELPKIRIVSNRNDVARLILAIGHQDTDVAGLSMPEGGALIGATSDHLVVVTDCATLKLGSEVVFQLNYKALMRAMAAPDVETVLLNDRPSKQSRSSPGEAEYLTLV